MRVRHSQKLEHGVRSRFARKHKRIYYKPLSVAGGSGIDQEFGRYQSRLDQHLGSSTGEGVSDRVSQAYTGYSRTVFKLL